MLREALFLILSGVSLILLLLEGIPFAQWQWLTWSGYHASHWNTAAAFLVYLIVGVPLYTIAWAQCFRWFFVRRGTDGKNTVSLGKDLSSTGITVSVLLIAALSAGAHFLVLSPLTSQLMHSYHDWPAALQLTAFQVCATDRKLDLEQAIQARGILSFEILNLSPSEMREVTFTVEAGRFWGAPRVHRFEIRDLAPQTKRRIDMEVDLGRITSETETSLSPTRLRARIYYGRVGFEPAGPVAVTPRPADAETTIGDCAKFKRIG